MTNPPLPVPPPLPLSGFRVLDLTRFLAGPYCTMVLADLGADVIKLEQPGTGDESRRFEPKVAGESYSFIQVNRGKRSLSLDLKDPRGAALARRLADRADLVIESFRPGVADSLGLGYAELSQDRPGLLYCSISGFGQTGSARPAPWLGQHTREVLSELGLAGAEIDGLADAGVAYDAHPGRHEERHRDG